MGGEQVQQSTALKELRLLATGGLFVRFVSRSGPSPCGPAAAPAQGIFLLLGRERYTQTFTHTLARNALLLADAASRPCAPDDSVGAGHCLRFFRSGAPKLACAPRFLRATQT